MMNAPPAASTAYDGDDQGDDGEDSAAAVTAVCAG